MNLYNQATFSKEITLFKGVGTHPVTWRPEEQKLRFSRKERILAQDYSPEILPALQISDSGLQFIKSCLFPAHRPTLGVSELPVPEITLSQSLNLFFYVHLYLIGFVSLVNPDTHISEIIYKYK